MSLGGGCRLLCSTLSEHSFIHSMRIMKGVERERERERSRVRDRTLSHPTPKSWFRAVAVEKQTTVSPPLVHFIIEFIVRPLDRSAARFELHATWTFFPLFYPSSFSHSSSSSFPTRRPLHLHVLTSCFTCSFRLSSETRFIAE